MKLFPVFLIFNALCFACDSKSLQNIEQIELSTPSVQRIYLIRHGESVLNIAHESGLFFVSGRSDPIPLTQKGEAQAIKLGIELVKKIPINADFVVCSSVAKRAQDTANHIFKSFSNHPKSLRGLSYDTICELSDGSWEGKLRDASYDLEMQKWRKLSAAEKFVTPRFSDGEAFADIIPRALPTLQKIVDEHPGKTIFIVMHSAVIKVLAGYLTFDYNQLSKEPGSELPQSTLPTINNCDMLLLELQPGQKIEQAVVKEHLVLSPVVD